jgi:hypothetical protein
MAAGIIVSCDKPRQVKFAWPRSLALVTLLAQTGCSSGADRPATEVVVPPPSSSSASAPPAGASAEVPVTIGDGAPLRVGLVRFEGMVRPTKGGFDVRGVIVDHGELASALSGRRAPAAHPEALLGAKVRMVAELARAGGVDDTPQDPSIAVQRRTGTWLDVRRIDSLEVVAEPVQIEGEVQRSKGLYQVGNHLVTADDLGWSLIELNGRFESKRVRLWGQPRTVICEPNAQCLIGGSLPMFDVGRAEVVR